MFEGKFVCQAQGLAFPEGPVAMSDGSVLVVEIRTGHLTRVSANGTLKVIAALGGGPNGAAIGPDGAAYVCNNGGLAFHDVGDMAVPGHAPPNYLGGSIQRVDLTTGAVTTLYTSCEGRGLRGPNDIVFDRDGGFYFTDLGKSDDATIDRGFLYYARPEGGRIACVRTGLIQPNGVGLSPDQKSLYVAETLTGRVWAFDIEAPGKLAPSPAPFSPGRLVVTLPGHHYVDSLAVDSRGRICLAAGPEGGIFVIIPDGSSIDHRRIPGEVIVTNICFGGSDLRDSWITASGSGRLYRTRWDVPGLKLNFNG